MNKSPTLIKQDSVNIRAIDEGMYIFGQMPERLQPETLSHYVVNGQLNSISTLMKDLHGNFTIFIKKNDATHFITSASSQGFFLQKQQVTFDYHEFLTRSTLCSNHILNYVYSHHGVRPHVLDKNTTFVPPMSVGKITNRISDLHTWANVVAENRKFAKIFEDVIFNYVNQFSESEHIVFYSGGVDSTLILLFLEKANMNPIAVHLRTNQRDTVFTQAVCDKFGITLEIIDPEYEYYCDDSFNWIPTLGMSPTDYIHKLSEKYSFNSPVFWHGQNADTIYHVENDSMRSRLDYVGGNTKSIFQYSDPQMLIKNLNDAYWEYRNHSKIDLDEHIHDKIMKSKEIMFRDYKSWQAPSNVVGLAQEARLYRFFQRMSNAAYRLRLTSKTYPIIMPFNEFSLLNYFNNTDIPNMSDVVKPKQIYHNTINSKFGFNYSKEKTKVLFKKYKYGLVEEYGDKYLPKPIINIYSKLKLDPRFSPIKYNNANVFNEHSIYLVNNVIRNRPWINSLNEHGNLGDLIMESDWFQSLLADDRSALNKEEFMALSKVEYLYKTLTNM